MFASALKFIMSQNDVTDIVHYLGDYFTCGPAQIDVCKSNLDTMLKTCKEIGFSVQPKKVEGPTKIIEYLGIVIDSEVMELRISETRLEGITNFLYEWTNRRSCVNRHLLSLIGKLVFVYTVVRPGRTFLRRTIELSIRVKHLHQHIMLNLECQRIYFGGLIIYQIGMVNSLLL